MVDDLTPDMPPALLLKRLKKAHESEVPQLERLDEHYEGEQPLSYMAPELVDELSDRIQQVVIPWPQLVADSAEERLDVDGFRLGGEPEADDELADIWQANDMDRQSQQGHLDAIVMRRAYAIVGPRSSTDASPLITVESPLEVIHQRCPRTRRIQAAAKWWTEGAGSDRIDHATLYLPNETSWWLLKDGDWVPDKAHAAHQHGRGVVPVEPIVNRPRLRRRRPGGEGVSDLSALIPLSDAACKIATDMMVGGEFHAVPRRVALGFTEEDFQDDNGNPVSAFQRAIGRVWSTERTKQEGAEVIQFPESDLSNFHGTIKLLAQLVASAAGLPPHYLGISTENPASADAIRSAESRLIKRVERKMTYFGASWEQVMRLALVVSGDAKADAMPMELLRMRTVWQDAATPTVAQKADAAVKVFQSGIVPKRQTREDLGYSQQQIDRMEEEDERDAARAFGLEAPARKAPAAPAAPADVDDDAEDDPAGAEPAA